MAAAYFLAILWCNSLVFRRGQGWNCDVSLNPEKPTFDTDLFGIMASSTGSETIVDGKEPSNVFGTSMNT